MQIPQFWCTKSWLRVLQYAAIVALCVMGVCLRPLPAPSQPPVTLKLLMTSPDVPPWTKFMVTAFEAEHPHIRLQIVEGPNQVNLLEDMYTTAFLLGNSPYDLVNMDVIWTPKFAAAGWLMDLTNDVTEAELAAFSPADVEGGKYAGRLYRLPVRSDAGMLYYRKDLLDAAGFDPPRTFEEIERIAQALQAQKAVRWGYLWQGKQYEGAAAMFVEVLKGFGGFWVNPDTLDVGLDRPEALKAIEFLQNTIRQGISPPGVTTYVEEDVRRIFQNGDAAFMRNWPYAWPLMNTAASPVNGKIGIIPMVGSQTTQDRGACLGGWGLGIAKTSKHKQEALEAIRFITSDTIQKQFILNSGYVPSQRRLFNDPQVVAQYSHYPDLLNVVDQAVLRPPIAQYAQASDILQRYLSAALTNQQTPAEAMQQAADETRRLLEAGRKQRNSA
ncbi:MAG: ABC transporter substrate-binding protein [Leptolyngbyaceae cyanobacterium bins.349]|nr:ABC transporter substrate-binding protein [Leptolyngbyaceae cyanobacterium bins.349]